MAEANNLHFHTFHLNTPRISGLVEAGLHDMGNGLALTEDLRQIFGTQHISESRGRQQSRGVTGNISKKT